MNKRARGKQESPKLDGVLGRFQKQTIKLVLRGWRGIIQVVKGGKDNLRKLTSLHKGTEASWRKPWNVKVKLLCCFEQVGLIPSLHKRERFFSLHFKNQNQFVSKGKLWKCRYQGLPTALISMVMEQSWPREWTCVLN